MTVEIIEVNSCKRNIAVEVPANEVDQEIDKIAREYARKAKVPGFRPGKVPLNIIRQRYGSDLQQEATQKIIERTWKDALEEHKFSPLAQPVVQEVDSKSGQPLKFTLAFEILPPLEVKDYKGVETTLSSSEITDENVNKALENLREQRAEFVPVDDGEASDGQYLTLTVDGEVEEADKPIHEDDVTLIVGQTQANAEFSENLRGARAGETRAFEVSYPEDHYRREFAGKKVQYSVLVKDIKEKHLPELSDDFAKNIGSESLEALKLKVQEEMVTQAKQSAEKKAREALLDTIVERQTIDIPECMVQDELEAYARRFASSLTYQGVDVNQADIDWKKMLDEQRPHAEQTVRRSIFLDAIARQEDIEVTNEEIESELQKVAEGTNKSAASWRAQLEKEGRFEGFKQHLRRNKALDFVYRNANITEE